MNEVVKSFVQRRIRPLWRHYPVSLYQRAEGAVKSFARRHIRPLWSHYLVGLYHRTDEHHFFLIGGGLAFSLFTCIVPFMLITFAILGKILEAAALEAQMGMMIDAMVPYAQQADFVKEVVFSRTRELVINRGVYGIVGVVLLVFTASGLFSSMRTILGMIFGFPRGDNDFWGKLRDFGMVFLVLFVFLVSIVFLPIVEGLKDSAMDSVAQFREIHSVTMVFFPVLSFLLLFTALFIFYLLISRGKSGKIAAAMSALWATVLWEVAKQVFGFYITHFASIQRIYGAYMLMAVVAFWIYYSSLIFILGAEIGQLYKERRKAIGQQAEPAGSGSERGR